MLVEQSLEWSSSEPSTNYGCSNMLRASRAKVSARGSSTSKPAARGFESSRGLCSARNFEQKPCSCSARSARSRLLVAYLVAYKNNPSGLHLTLCMLHISDLVYVAHKLFIADFANAKMCAT